ncbi:MAG: hypothetical protein JO199_08720 [Candidatus Eremiobacteraeota bacterium]|nr:hypothetical protein [Candidatus Eremiobacteraeota bacterium]
MNAALAAARERLHDAQLAVARAGAGENGGRTADRAMAATAQAAVFDEALLGAERARFEELKGVTR